VKEGVVKATIANIPKVKRKLRAYVRVHCLDLAAMTITAPVWGTAARRNAWRATGHMRSHGKKVKQSARYTQELVDALLPPAFVERQQRYLVAQLGVKEYPAGSNSGPRVRSYQKITGAFAQPWCASLVAAADVHAGLSARHLPKLPAYVPSWAATESLHIRSVAKGKARRGDHLCLFGNGHIETVTKVVIPGLVWRTIGGNTSPDSGGSQSNGGMVCRKTRYVRDVSAVKRVRL